MPPGNAHRMASQLTASGKEHQSFAAYRCPDCGGPLVVSADRREFRRCEKCKLAWFAQFSERDGSAKPTSLIASWCDADWPPVRVRSRDRGHLEAFAARQRGHGDR